MNIKDTDMATHVNKSIIQKKTNKSNKNIILSMCEHHCSLSFQKQLFKE